MNHSTEKGNDDDTEGICEELNKEGAKTEDLHNFCMWGYERENCEDCIKLFDVLAPYRPNQPDWMRKAY